MIASIPQCCRQRLQRMSSLTGVLALRHTPECCSLHLWHRARCTLVGWWVLFRVEASPGLAECAAWS